MDWTPNPLWQQLASTAENNTFSALHAVYPLSPNWCTVQFTMSAGQYTVAWGDSTSENVNSGVTAYKSFSYASCPDNDIGKADEVACTFTDSGDTVNITGHQFVNGNLVSFSNVTTTTGISAGSLYYVVNAATNTFKVSDTIGGVAVTLTNDGSGKIYIPKYRTVVVNVTPTSVGASFTAFNLSVRHTSATAVAYSTQWLDVAINAQSCTTQTVYSTNVTHANMKRFQGDLRSVANFTSLFQSCYSLTSVPLLNTASGTNFASMFQNCYSLISVPLLNTASGTNFTSMFQSCYSLTSVPLLNTASGTNFTAMFLSCYSLDSVPLLNTAAGTNFASMFQNCYSLISVPLLNTASGTNFSAMFNTCYSLTSVPLLNTASGTNFANMFNTCYSLVRVPAMIVSSGSDFTTMFSGCKSLASAPLIGAVQDISYSNAQLSAAELNRIYSQLGTAAKTITITGCYGAATDDPSIATAKGWTVVS